LLLDDFDAPFWPAGGGRIGPECIVASNALPMMLPLMNA
jgi:hypothetical protein